MSKNIDYLNVSKMAMQIKDYEVAISNANKSGHFDITGLIKDQSEQLRIGVIADNKCVDAIRSAIIDMFSSKKEKVIEDLNNELGI